MMTSSLSRTAEQRHTRREAGSQSYGTRRARRVSRAASAGTSSEELRRGGAAPTCAVHSSRPGGTAMLARIRKAQEEREGGFTLIELLVVMIIIGILAAIAIPIFLNQRKKAQDSAAKADVSTIGKEVATYFVDNAGVPVVTILANGRYQLSDGTYTTDLGKASNNVVMKAPTAATGTVDSTHWCFGVTNPQGDLKNWKYSAQNGLENGVCADKATP